MRGWFGIGIYHPKKELNVGTLWRSAYQMGAAFIYTIGRRYSVQSSDTPGTPQHIPLLHYDTFEEFYRHKPGNAPLIGIEIGGVALNSFVHPQRGVYLLGAEDHGIPPAIMAHCNWVVGIPSVRMESYNVAVSGSLVMYDRMVRGSFDRTMTTPLGAIA